MNNGLILTMGLSPEPLIFSIKELEASSVVFIGTGGSIEKSINETIKETGLNPSQYKTIEIPDDSSKAAYLCEKFQEGKDWLEAKGVEQIFTDPTGGRKWMSAGATMAASGLGLQMLYIDAKYDKGVIDKDTMKSVKMGNAYDQTGFIWADKGRDAFNKMDFEGATYQFGNIKPSQANKIAFYSGLSKLCGLLAKWDRFEHYNSSLSIEIGNAISTIESSLEPLNSNSEMVDFLSRMKSFSNYISSFESIGDLNIQFITDIFLNARRCIKRGRYDDAIARQYRTLESISQFILKTNFNFDCSKPEFSILNDQDLETFRKECRGQQLPEKIDLKLGFWLLRILNHPIKDLVFKGKMAYKDFILEGILSSRNSSILAHGFKPIRIDKVEKFDGALFNILKSIFPKEFSLAEEILSIPNMPKLGF